MCRQLVQRCLRNQAVRAGPCAARVYQAMQLPGHGSARPRGHEDVQAVSSLSWLNTSLPLQPWLCGSCVLGWSMLAGQ